MARRKSINQIEAQERRLVSRIMGVRDRMGGGLNDAFRRRYIQLNQRINRVTGAATRYSLNLMNRPDNYRVLNEYAQRRTGRDYEDRQLARQLGVDNVNNRQYSRSTYMGLNGG